MSATGFPNKHSITAAEYLRMAEAGVFAPDARLELMDGEIIEMAPIGSRHAAVVNTLNALFNRKAGDRAIASIQNALVLSDRTVPQPDLALLKPSPDRYFSALPAARDVLLLVEVADSTLRFDLERKCPLYARAGITETWVIDVNLQRLRILRDPVAGEYQSVQDITGNSAATVQALPDVAIVVADLFPS